MEFINKIELCGIVGNVTNTTVGGTSLSRFSLCVEEAYKNADGTPIIESTWFNCTAWQGEKIKDISKIQKGKAVHLKGRVRMQHYTAQEGSRYIWEIFCTEVEVLSKK
jgi:single-stranded DNA-binding protein